MVPVPDNARKLFERPIICALATLMPNGQPQVNPVWCDYDGQYVRINTARGRQKDRNMTQRAKVTVMLFDPDDAQHWAKGRETLVRSREEGPTDTSTKRQTNMTGMVIPLRPVQFVSSNRANPKKLSRVKRQILE